MKLVAALAARVESSAVPSDAPTCWAALTVAECGHEIRKWSLDIQLDTVYPLLTRTLTQKRIMSIHLLLR
jgi:hypothetical protein